MNSTCLNRSFFVWGAALAMAAMLSFGGGALAADKKGLRPSLGKPMQAVQELLQQRKYEEALAALDEAEKELKRPTPYETYVFDRLRGSAATGAGRYEVAIEAYKGVLASEELPEEERAPILNAAARMTYTAKKYDESIDLIRQYREAGGDDRQTIALLPQALYVTDRFAEAAEALIRYIGETEAAGEKPDEYLLQLLSSAQVKNGDIRGYLGTLRKSVIHYPSREYWTELIGSTVDYYNIPLRLMLPVYRLRQWTGTLNTATDYMEATQTALQDGYPHEARQFIRQGFESGELGNGTPTEVNRHNRLEEHVERKVVEDRRVLAEGERLALQKPNGDPLVNTGFNYITLGEYEKGLDLMRQGLERGGLRYPAEARLLYAYGLLLAGQADAALKVFSSIKEEDGPAYRLAELWRLAVGHDEF